MRSAKDYEMVVNFSGEMVETRYVHSSKDILKRNYEETEVFLENIASAYTVHYNDPEYEFKGYQYLNVAKDKIIEFLSVYSAHPLNVDFAVSELLPIFIKDDQKIFDYWDIVIAGGLKATGEISLAGLKVHPVRRGFEYREDTKSLQMSGKNSRLGSKDLAKGGLTKETVRQMEKGYEEGKAFGERFYFNTGIKRNPLLVIYPVKLSVTSNSNQQTDERKRKIAEAIDFPVIGLSIGIPRINGKKREVIKYKINKQKWLELFGADDTDDLYEVDETIPEE